MGRRGAFTLIELLVVISIIALLIAILLPALSAATEAGRRSKCLANQHQLAISMATFAVEHDGGIALTYRDGQKQSNYFVVANHANLAYGALGHLHAWGLLSEKSWIVCPSMTRPNFINWADAPQSTSGSQTNQWPPYLIETSQKRHTRASYGVRPMDSYAPDGGLGLDTAILQMWDGLSQKVVLSDVATIPSHLDTSHGDGINVTFGDGSSAWRNRAVINDSLNLIPDTSFSAGNNDLILTDDETDGIYALLDDSR